MKRTRLLAKAKLRRKPRQKATPSPIVLRDEEMGTEDVFTIPPEQYAAYKRWTQTGVAPKGLGAEEWAVLRWMIEKSLGLEPAKAEAAGMAE